MCRNPLWGGILGGALGFAGPTDGFFGGAVLHPYIDGDGSGRRGAVQIRSSMWEDGLAQEDDAVWRRGGVDGSKTWHGRCNSTALKMDSWQVAAAASYPTGVLVVRRTGRCPIPGRCPGWDLKS